MFFVIEIWHLRHWMNLRKWLANDWRLELMWVFFLGHVWVQTILSVLYVVILVTEWWVLKFLHLNYLVLAKILLKILICGWGLTKNLTLLYLIIVGALPLPLNHMIVERHLLIANHITSHLIQTWIALYHVIILGSHTVIVFLGHFSL